MNSKAKIPVWKIIIGVLFLPFTAMYFVFKYIIKFYRSTVYTKKQKIIATGIVFIIFMMFGFVGSLTTGPELESVNIKDISLYKDEEKEINIEIEPNNAQIRNKNYKEYDEKIIKIKDDKIIALNDGKTTIICEIEDAHGNIIKSNKFNVVVSLTDEQIAIKKEKEKEAEEQKKREKEKAKNTLSTSESVTIKNYCKDIINSILKAPSTAEYPGSFLNPFDDWAMVKKNNIVTVSSYVDAQNSFGAMVRSKFVIQVKMNDNGSGKATYVEFDGEVVSGKYQK